MTLQIAPSIPFLFQFGYLVLLFILPGYTSAAGPAVFTFTSEPTSQQVFPGGTVTLSCVASGRETITYTWYKLDTGFTMPPRDTVSGEAGSTLIVAAADVDDPSEMRMFQCSAATSSASGRSELIYSDVATITYTLPSDNIVFSGQQYQNMSRTVDDVVPDAVVLALKCNGHSSDIDSEISNGNAYNVYWYKDSESSPVNYTNMWTNYALQKGKVIAEVSGADYEADSGRYDLVIYNVKPSDAGKYYCKAESANDSVTLGSTILTVNVDEITGLAMNAKSTTTGYTVQAVANGKLKSVPNVGDSVLLMCGAVCRSAGGSNDVQYEWTMNGVIIASTPEFTVTIQDTVTVSYTCGVKNCGLQTSTSSINIDPQAAIEDFSTYSFSSHAPRYMWYMTSNNNTSTTPFEINCAGNDSLNTKFVPEVYKNGVSVAAGAGYIFQVPPAPTESGVYQCVVTNSGITKFLRQKTSNVIIASDPTVSMTATQTSIINGTDARFTCQVSGYPIESVTITKDSTSTGFDCIDGTPIGTASCSKISDSEYVMTIRDFSDLDSGLYTCSVATKWYKTDGTVMGNTANSSLSLDYVKLSTTVLTFSTNPAQVGDTSVTVICTVEGSPEPPDPVLIHTTADGNVLTVPVTCTGTVAKSCIAGFSPLQGVGLYDNGEYRCEGYNVVDGVRHNSSDTQILVVESDATATLTLSPPTAEPDLNSNVTMTCSIASNPPPTRLIMRRDQGSVVYKDYTSAVAVDPDIVVVDVYSISYTLTLNFLQLSDSSRYECAGENMRNSSVRSGSVVRNVTVISPVTVDMDVDKQFPVKGDNVTVTCTAHGGRKPHLVELKRDDVVLKTNFDAGFCVEPDEFTLQCTQTLSNIGYEVSGDYSCLAKNRVKNNTEHQDQMHEVVAVSHPVAVSSSQAGSVQETAFGTSLNLTCTVEGGLAPHKVVLKKPKNGVELIWTRIDGDTDTLTCSGENVVTCSYQTDANSYRDSGQFQWLGYNYLPTNLTNELTSMVTTDVTIVGNVTVSLNASSREVKFGAAFTLECVASGGQIPFYLELTWTSVDGSGTKQLVLYDKRSNVTSSDVLVDENYQKLTFVYDKVTSAGYGDIGSYTCVSKNVAVQGREVVVGESVDIIVVRPVETTIIAPPAIRRGAVLTISCIGEGYRPPSLMSLSKDDTDLIVWHDPAKNCTSDTFYKFTCTFNVSTSTGYAEIGNYTCTSKNTVAGNVEVTDQSSSVVEISEPVTTSVYPKGYTEVSWGTGGFEASCTVDGGLQPHRVEVKTPLETLHWIPHDSSNSLPCTGDHIVTCTFPVSATTYDDSGNYTCTGYNYLPDNTSTELTSSSSFQLQITRDVFVTFNHMSTNVDSIEAPYGDPLKISCTAEGSKAPFYFDLSHSGVPIVIYNSGAITPTSAIPFISESTYTVAYSHQINNASYADNGEYECSAKNRALQGAEKMDTKNLNVIIVKDVEIIQPADVEVDVGGVFTVEFSLNGGRPPYSISVESPNGQTLFNWTRSDQNQIQSEICVGDNEMKCSVNVTEAGYSHDGVYKIGARNVASNWTEKTAYSQFGVTVYKDVDVAILPAVDATMKYHDTQTVMCTVDGGLPPHTVELLLPNGESKVWERNNSSSLLTCTGIHVVVCSHSFTAEYDSDGTYECRGVNTVRAGVETQSEARVELITVRATEISMTESSTAITTDGTLELNCTVVGKPLEHNITWIHTNSAIDLRSNFTTTLLGDFSLISTLVLEKPSTEYSGRFTCVAGDTNYTSPDITITEAEFLNDPVVWLSPNSSVEKGELVSIRCQVRGLPEKEVSVIILGADDGVIDTLVPQSTSLREKVFSFDHNAGCQDYGYRCDVKTVTRTASNTGGVIIDTASTSVSSPVVEGCELTEEWVQIGAGVGGLMGFIVILTILLLFLLPRCRKVAKQDLQYRNPTFDGVSGQPMSEMAEDKSGHNGVSNPTKSNMPASPALSPSATDQEESPYISVEFTPKSVRPAAQPSSSPVSNPVAQSQSEGHYATITELKFKEVLV